MATIIAVVTRKIIERRNITPEEILSAAYSSESRGTAGPRSWIEEELRKEPPRVLGQLAGNVKREELLFANGPLEIGSTIYPVYSGPAIQFAFATAAVIARGCKLLEVYPEPVAA